MTNRGVDRISAALDDPTVVLVAAAVTILVLVGLRVLVGVVIGDTVLVITYLGVVGGTLGAIAMVLAFDAFGFTGASPAAQFWSRALGTIDPRDAVRQGMYVHLVYGAVLGGTFPRVVHLALGGGWYNELPTSLAGGALFATALFALAITYRLAGLYEMDLSVRMLWRYYAYHLVYGLVLGFVGGLHMYL